MHHPLLSVALVAAFGYSAAAHALTCHIVLDRTDTIVYRDIVPPVDLSDRGRASRAAMRHRGEFLLMMEADQCAKFVATTGTPGSGGATVDEIVAGLRSYQGAAGGGGIMTSPGPGPSPGPSSAPASGAPSAPAAARSGRGY